MSKIIDLEGLKELAREIVAKFATKDEVSSKISAAYIPAGSQTSLSSALLTKTHVGYVYNMSQEFTTNATDFVDGDNKTYPAGTNVVVVEEDSGVYKFDVLSGFVDLSNYIKVDEIATAEEIRREINEIFTELTSSGR